MENLSFNEWLKSEELKESTWLSKPLSTLGSIEDLPEGWEEAYKVIRPIAKGMWYGTDRLLATIIFGPNYNKYLNKDNFEVALVKAMEHLREQFPDERKQSIQSMDAQFEKIANQLNSVSKHVDDVTQKDPSILKRIASAPFTLLSRGALYPALGIGRGVWEFLKGIGNIFRGYDPSAEQEKALHDLPKLFAAIEPEKRQIYWNQFKKAAYAVQNPSLLRRVAGAM